MSDQVKPRRKRGVPLNDLDRSVRWVIAFTGRRWEVVGPAGETDAPWEAQGEPASGARRTLGRHAAPDPASPDRAQLDR